MKRRDRKTKRVVTPVEQALAAFGPWTAADHERVVWLPTLLRPKRRRGK